MMAILRRSVRSTNIHSPYFKCRCEEGVLPDEAISQSLEIATPFGLAMTGSLHTKTPDGEGRGFYLNKIKRSAWEMYSIRLFAIWAGNVILATMRYERSSNSIVYIGVGFICEGLPLNAPVARR